MKRAFSVGMAGDGLSATGAAVLNEDLPVGPGEDATSDVHAESSQRVIPRKYEMSLVFDSTIEDLHAILHNPSPNTGGCQ